jgi:hypothetical protein
MADHVVDFSDSESKRKYWEYLKTLEGIRIMNDEPKGHVRSIGLNKYYFGVVLRYISEYTGFDVETLHDYFKIKFFPYVNFIQDQDLTTASCSEKTMWRLVNKVRHWALLKFKLDIPDPKSVIRPKELF